MGIEFELATSFALHVPGTSMFTAFEVETPWWVSMLKWTLVVVATVLVL